jgi:hypothetical protein
MRKTVLRRKDSFKYRASTSMNSGVSPVLSDFLRQKHKLYDRLAPQCTTAMRRGRTSLALLVTRCIHMNKRKPEPLFKRQ